MLIPLVEKELLYYAESINKNINNISILLSYSSGIDSTVLLDIIYKLQSKYSFILSIAHLNHNSNHKSKEMEGFAKLKSLEKSATLHLDHAYFNKSNFEANARSYRYTWLNKLKVEYRYDFILTAHHYDDQLETIEMKLRNNSDWTNLLGIKGELNFIRRPLLEIKKDEIREYANINNINYIDDPSNQNTYFLRNRIRLVDLPLKKSNFKDYEMHLTKVHDKALHNLKDFLTRIKNSNVVIKESEDLIIINKNIFFSFDFHEKKIFIQSIIKKNFGIFLCRTKANWENIFNFVTHKNKENKFFDFSTNIRISKYNNYIYFDMFSDSNYNCININLSDTQLWANYIFNCQIVGEYQESKMNEYLIIPKALIEKGLYIRKWKCGDRIFLGDNRSRKLSKLFSNNKLSLLHKSVFPVICDSYDNILWLPGIRICMMNNLSGPYIKVSYEIKYEI